LLRIHYTRLAGCLARLRRDWCKTFLRLRLLLTLRFGRLVAGLFFGPGWLDFSGRLSSALGGRDVTGGTRARYSRPTSRTATAPHPGGGSGRLGFDGRANRRAFGDEGVLTLRLVFFFLARFLNQRIREYARRRDVNESPFVGAGQRVFVEPPDEADIVRFFECFQLRWIAFELSEVKLDAPPVLLAAVEQRLLAGALVLEDGDRQLDVEGDRDGCCHEKHE
jgi:hypothetical protein